LVDEDERQTSLWRGAYRATDASTPQ